MNTFLLSWNPDKSSQQDFSDEYKKFTGGASVVKTWSVTRNSKPGPGDRFYIIKLGKKGRGIFGSGEIMTPPKELPHYDPELAKQGKMLKYCDIQFDRLVDGGSQTLIGMEELEGINRETGIEQHWSAENSGIQINESILVNLEKLWSLRTDTLSPAQEDDYFKAIENLDGRVERLQRIEQSFLRSKLFRDNKYAECCICGELMPVQLLVCAHIKKRAICSDEEKRDFNNVVVAMCRLGCDELYERGYISVKNGKVISLPSGPLLKKVQDYIDNITGKHVSAYDSGSKQYFDWHYAKYSSNK
jgi:hypothetical protein